jgi:hypothetical protein
VQQCGIVRYLLLTPDAATLLLLLNLRADVSLMLER